MNQVFQGLSGREIVKYDGFAGNLQKSAQNRFVQKHKQILNFLVVFLWVALLHYTHFPVVSQQWVHGVLHTGWQE